MNQKEESPSIEVKVDFTKIVKYCCIATVCVVGIICGTRFSYKMAELEKRK
ncbi:MAG: hypothetical protein ACERKN_06865 [Velocimicrobium sp.]